MMNILYVWFPASWGPSVVEAIQKRNETWLAQKPVIRDPQTFNRAEVTMGPASRELTYKIQKWNVHSEGFHPILVANARVDWLALKDEDITQKFSILLEGILQDVFSQRASSAWQGAQPQKITVSLLLPGTSTAAQWRDLLQSRRQFWPTLTTRHASLVPLCADALQRERRQMAIETPLVQYRLTGWSLTRNSKRWLPLGLPVSRFGNTSFLPSIDRILSWKGDTKEWTTKKWSKNGRLPRCTFGTIRDVLAPSVSTWKLLSEASTLTTLLLRRQLMCPKLFMHVDGRPRMASTVSRNMSSLTSVMAETSLRTLVPLPPTLFPIPRIGLMTTPWVTDFFWRGAGHMVSVHYLEEFDM